MSARRLMLSGPASLALGAALIWLRGRYFGLDGLGNAWLAISMAAQFVGYQRMLAQEQPRAMAQGIEFSQWGWFLFALGLPGQGPALASAGFLVLQLLVKAPLAAILIQSGFRHRFVILGGFLALVGCLPFSSFSAYFQAFVPLMAVGASVTSMQQKLFSGAGLWAALVMLSVVYQSCALGYFYWSRVLSSDDWRAPRPRSWVFWLAAGGLCVSAIFGVFRGVYVPLIQGGLSALGVQIHP
jgi:hypothetical protein